MINEKEALEILSNIVREWEMDDNMYSETMSITVNQKDINAIVTAIKALEKQDTSEGLPFDVASNAEFDIWNDSERKVVCVRTSTDIHSLLEIGKEYTVANVDVHSWNTDVYLKEFGGDISFNSVCFNEIEQKEG